MMIGILLLCLISTRNAVSQNVTWVVGTPDPIFKQDLKLVCSVSLDCCTSFPRIWEDGTGTQILYNGISSSPEKYQEEWDRGTTGFNLIIKNLQLSDVGVDYKCQYRVGEDKHTLRQENPWIFPPPIPNDCPIDWKWNSYAGKISGTFNISRSATSPTAVASFGGENISSSLTLTEPTKFDDFFYTATISIDRNDFCKNGELFTLDVLTGPVITHICKDAEICAPQCYRCGGIVFGFGLVGDCVGFLLVFFSYLFGLFNCNSWFYTRKLLCCKFERPKDFKYNYRHLKKDYNLEHATIIKALVIAAAVTFGFQIVVFTFTTGFILGIHCFFCIGLWELCAMFFGFGIVGFPVNLYWTLEYFNDVTSSWLRYGGLMLLTNLVFPIPFLVYFCCLKDKNTINEKEIAADGGKSQSVESGSPEKERADKKKERKPTEVVRPQPSRPLPSRAQHLKTDNTGREEYSAENELFKPRPLPSISGHSDSRRPLPKRTPDDQLEKGGIQLEPLVESTSEKKKKKKRKKKETKQSDEDD